MTDLVDYRKQLDPLLAQYKHSSENVREETRRLEEATVQLQHIEEAGEIIQKLAMTLQETAHTQVASIVSKCLQTVFADPYEMRIIFERKRGKTEARLVFVRDQLEVDPLTAAGGGVVDVAAFALRLSCLVLSQPQLRRLVVLDEPFKFVSEEYREHVRDMLIMLADELQIQFILVTHIDELRCGTIIELDHC